jgi:hypothetical protein
VRKSHLGGFGIQVPAYGGIICSKVIMPCYSLQQNDIRNCREFLKGSGRRRAFAKRRNARYRFARSLPFAYATAQRSVPALDLRVLQMFVDLLISLSNPLNMRVQLTLVGCQLVRNDAVFSAGFPNMVRLHHANPLRLYTSA